MLQFRKWHIGQRKKQLFPPVSAWAETLELLLTILPSGPLCSWMGEGAPPPSSVGYELLSENREIIAEAEMAWEAEKVVWLLPEQAATIDIFTARGGWTVFVGEEIPN